ncbi:MAG: hypothetical protein AB1425_16100 [Actinomycetota bacterium]
MNPLGSAAPPMRAFSARSVRIPENARGYEPPTLMLRRTYLIALAILVAAFVALHPCLGAAGFCDPGGAPHATQAHAAPSVDPSAAASLALVASFALALAAFLRPVSDRRPDQAYLSPDPHPPRPPQSR